MITKKKKKAANLDMKNELGNSSSAANLKNVNLEASYKICTMKTFNNFCVLVNVYHIILVLLTIAFWTSICQIRLNIILANAYIYIVILIYRLFRSNSYILKIKDLESMCIDIRYLPYIKYNAKYKNAIVNNILLQIW